jgi:hypothetical protein
MLTQPIRVSILPLQVRRGVAVVCLQTTVPRYRQANAPSKNGAAGRRPCRSSAGVHRRRSARAGSIWGRRRATHNDTIKPPTTEPSEPPRPTTPRAAASSGLARRPRRPRRPRPPRPPRRPATVPLCDLLGLDPRGSYHLPTEQIDGAFTFRSPAGKPPIPSPQSRRNAAHR